MMFVVDGIAYAAQPAVGMRIVDARVVGELCMLVRFSTGEERVFDASTLIEAPAFAPLHDAKAFEDFSLECGIITWLGGAVDIAPEKVYALSYPYTAAGFDAGIAYA